MDKKAFGKRLKQARNEKGYTSEKLAELIQVNPVFIRQIEGGVKLPSVPKLVDLCCALKVSPDFLLGQDLVQKRENRLEELTVRLNALSPKQMDLVFYTVQAMIDQITA